MDGDGDESKLWIYQRDPSWSKVVSGMLEGSPRAPALIGRAENVSGGVPSTRFG